MADPISFVGSIAAIIQTAAKVQNALRLRASGSLSVVLDDMEQLGAITNNLAKLSADGGGTQVMSAQEILRLQEILQVQFGNVQRMSELEASTKGLLTRSVALKQIHESMMTQNESLARLLEPRISAMLLRKAQISDSIVTPDENLNRMPGGDHISLNHDPPRPVDNPVLVNYLKQLGSRERKYFQKFTFREEPAFYIRANVDMEESNDAVLCVKNYKHKLPVGAGLEGNANSRLDLTQDPEAVFLLLCANTEAASNIIPFDQENFIEIMQKFQVPNGTYKALFTGTPRFVCYGEGERGNPAGLILRNPMSAGENWTLSLSWNSHLREIKGIVHGLKQEDMSRLATYIGDIGASIAHPLAVPVIMCEMLLESDSNEVKRQASSLILVENRTIWDEAMNVSILAEMSGNPFAQLTRTLNYIVSRLAFHEMRIHANMVFVSEITASLDNILISDLKTDKDNPVRDEDWTKNFESMSRTIRERLIHLRSEQRALLLEITCNQKIAQSQIEIVYNLVAQRDNQDNLLMAKTQTDIARITEADSFAMRTIAIMSIFFLPGTFVSSFFSMDMFDWQASKGTSVISSRFWIYWAVTVPLTILVLSIWFWHRAHHEKTRRSAAKAVYRADARPAADKRKSQHQPKERPWIRTKWADTINKDVENQTVGVIESGRSSMAAFKES
ncbi:hypothetical protein FB567DRAFT_629057 [Paraphoma chrysanthemicola]|uniref:Uncharacterized protein n=1 Tax=Paraphoma chrysanthemicola TaxID=798071 RepID=A0A8K0VYN1_9PLEO|nr:hypothetical protein FB567DRAFT_629057 [Paraphoma chrysanthemicola]